MKNENYINIQGWMVNELKLSGNELLIFALIYGFSQDGESEFKGSIRYIQEWLGFGSNHTVLSNVKKLEEKGLVASEFKDNCTYYKVVQKVHHRGAESAPQSGAESASNNNNNINKNNNNLERDFFYEKITDKAESKADYMKRKGLPYTPRKQTDAQKEAFKKSMGAQPVIDYFKEQGQQIHGMYFLQGSELRNKQVKGQIKNVIGMIKDYKALIDWWFNNDNSWANYEPEALFKEKIIERFLNKDKAESVSKKPLLQIGDLKLYTQEEINKAYNSKLIFWSEAGNCWKKTQ